mmetsp:Transcript_20689/g.46940  ORF Transcript_20689/g.46940 Transcript_20689/m.46940 type:complete len:221 (-) Transcript_20689:986-1648(-)
MVRGGGRLYKASQVLVFGYIHLSQCSKKGLFIGSQYQPSFSLLPGPSCSTQSMDVGLPSVGCPELDHVGDAGIINSSGGNIGGEQDNIPVSGAKFVRGLSSMSLCLLRVYLQYVNPEGGPEDGGVEADETGGREEDDDLVVWLLHGLGDNADHVGHERFGPGEDNVGLFSEGVGLSARVAIVNAVHREKVWAEAVGDHLAKISGEGGGEKQRLAGGGGWG